MDISGLFIRIVFLLLPGILASSIYRKLKGRTTRKDWEDYSEIIIFSLLSYILYALLLSVVNPFRIHYGWTEIKFTAFDAFFDDKISIGWEELFWASLTGISLSFIAALSYKNRFINRFGHWLGVTNHVGEEDIWYFFHNLPDVQWVYVRDHKADIVYFGWVAYYSDPYKEREMLLRDVSVYVNSTGEELYTCDAIYISRNYEDLTIEVANETAKIIKDASNETSEDKTDG